MSVYEKMSESQQFAARVIADHARATAFAIADGILPGNEGRNYVLRKIMRRAIYHGREHLGLTKPFFYKVCDFVVDKMHGAYPELETQREFIGKIVKLEEERFSNTMSTGLGRFREEFDNWFNVLPKSIEVFRNALEIDEDLLQALETKNEFIEQMRSRYGSTNLQHPARLIQLMYKYQIPPYLFKMFVLEKRDELSTRNDTLNWYYTTAESGKDEFEISIGMDWKDFLEAFGTDKEKQHVSLLQSPKAIVDWLDTHFSGNDEFRQLNFTDFARNYDTYGTPRDLIKICLEEKGVTFDDEEFGEKFTIALQELQRQSSAGKTERKSDISPIYAEILERVGGNAFRGYDTTHIDDSKVVAILDGEKQINELGQGAQGSVVLNETPFYAESGGQVGDTGKLVTAAASAPVHDTYSPVAGLIIHKVTVDKGTIKVGDVVTATVDVERRDATRRNHTATHLVHAALKEVLGTHVKQAGSVVAPNYLRFDFAHYQPMTAGEIAEVEDLVNRYILHNEPVTTDMMKLEDAMRSGAVAMFGEKYGGEVRVLSVGDGAFSKELCGGTHVRFTGDIGSFKITSDEAIASGVRRIRAITGFDAFERFREDERLIDASLGALNTQRDNLPNAIAKLAEELKKTRKEMDELKLKIALGSGQGSVASGQSSDEDQTREINGVKVLAKQVDGLDANGQRQLSDTLLARLKSGVVILGRSDEGKVSIIVRVSDDLTDRVKAGNVIKEIVPIVGGRGGGRADMAEGGGTEPDKLAEAIDASYVVIERMLG